VSQACRRGERHAFAWLAAGLALTLAPGAGLAAAGRVSAVHVHRLAVEGRLHQEAWVSALDAEGLPVADLRAQDFVVSEDGRPATVLDLTTFAAYYARTTWVILVDPELLQPASRGPVGSLVASLGRNVGPRDRLRLVSLGRDGRAVEAGSADAAALAAEFSSAAGGPVETPLYDVLHREVRRAARGSPKEGRVVWLVTRGADAGSAHSPAEVLAMSRAHGRRVPVSVLLLESRAPAGDVDRLAALAERSGGSLSRVAMPEGLPGEAQRLLARTRGAYRLRFDAPFVAQGVSRHRLEVGVQQAGTRPAGELAFDAADVVGPAWWQAPQVWLTPVALLVLALLAFLALRPRRICRLVVQTGEEKGCSYEVFGLPVTLGAAANNDITFPDGRVSRSHAQLEARASRVELIDLNSENGTFVNGTRVQRRPLERGDRVSLGGAVELRYEGRG